MKAIEIDNLKKITADLFTGTAFDKFLILSANIRTLTEADFDGHIHPEFLTEDEKTLPENQEPAVCWAKLRPLCYDIIKGKKLPLYFKLVFMMPKASISRFIQSANLDFDPGIVGGLYLNMTFEGGKLSCVTGTSLTTFTMDRSLEQAWDAQAERFLIRLEG